jgi:hypothetical protein
MNLPSYFRLGALGLSAALLSSCMTTEPKPGPVSPWVGKSIDSLRNVVQLLVHNGQLLIANGGTKNPGIAVADTGTGKITAFYPELLPPSGMAVAENRYVIISETDYTEGSISVLDLTAKSLRQTAIPFGSDNFVDTASGKTYMFDHTTGVVTGFTGSDPSKNITVNVQTGANSNPYDIAVANGMAFIPRYNLKSLLIFDPTKLDGGTQDSVDLSAYVSMTPSDSAAPAPRMAWTTAYNGYVFVALQRLNYNYAALDTSLVLVIDAATKQVVSTIPLHFKNPVSAHAVGTTWYVTGLASYGDQEGGVEKIDLAGRAHAGNVVTEQTLGADVFDFVPTSDHAGFVSYSSDYAVTTQVKRISF